MSIQIEDQPKTNALLSSSMLLNNKDHAIRILYDSYWKQLVCYAYTYLEDWDTSEEMVQELFIRIYEKNICLHEDGNLSVYLYRSVKNAVSNHLRKQAVYHRHLLRKNEASVISLQQIISGVEIFDLKSKIKHAIESIPERCKIVYVLNREQQLTIKEIAKKLNRPEDTVDKQLRRAVSFLKRYLNPLLS